MFVSIVRVPSPLDVLMIPSVDRLDSLEMSADEVAVKVPAVRLPTEEVADTIPPSSRSRVEVALAATPPQVVGVQANAPDTSVFNAYVDDANACNE